jgi:hypothetical protein
VTAVLFPWARGCPHRDAAARWVMGQWTRYHPRIPQMTTGDHSKFAAGPWSKGRHLAALLDRAPDGIIIVSDIDVWTPPDAIRDAVSAVQVGAGWAIPHGDVYRLTRQATDALVADERGLLLQRLADRDMDQPPYPGHPGGGIVVLPTATAREIPLDPRFWGWGQEDDSWALALTTLVGTPWRGRAPLIHLWHPPQDRRTRGQGSHIGVALYRQYLAASHHPDAMRALIAKIREES